jgi:hypothetical protein
VKPCPYCGAPLGEGLACTCPGAVQAARNPQQYYQQPQQYQQYQQPQQAYQQTAYQQPQPQQYYQQPQPQYQPQYMQPPKLPGQTMIKVSGILLTIFGAFAIIIGIGNLAVMAELQRQLNRYGESIPYVLLVIFGFVSAGLTLAFGIAGIVSACKPERGMMVLAFGAVLIGIQLLNIILSLIAFMPLLDNHRIDSAVVMGLIVAAIFGGAVNCTLPILYVVGGSKLKKSRSPY